VVPSDGTTLVQRLRDALRSWALRRLGVPCGAYGGRWAEGDRWCLQPFGHEWSCSYEVCFQPLWRLRARRRGWDA